MTIENYILKNGPTLSGKIIEFYKNSGASDEAIRKRISRVGNTIFKIKGFFKNNQTFLYHKDQYNTDIFYTSLLFSIKTDAKKHYSIIIALDYHKGYMKKDNLASYSFSPVKNLKTHKSFLNVINDLIRLNIIYEEDEYYTLSPLFSESSSNNFNYYKAIELSEDLLANHFFNYTRSIGLISYNKGEFHSEFCKFQFGFTAPSYISGILKNDKILQPAFILADFLIGSNNNESSIDFFIQKIKIIKSQTKNNFLPFLITDVVTTEALKKLKENGIIIGFVDKIFGNEYTTLLESLISIVTNAGAVLKSHPEAYLDLLNQLNRLTEGKTNNLRGDLFELAVGYYYSNYCQSLTIGKKANYNGSFKDIDVYAVFQEKLIVCECKAYKAKIDLKKIEDWISNKIPFIYKSIKQNDNDKTIIFEFWSTSGFTDEAINLLEDKKKSLKKYEINYYSEKDILIKAETSKTKKITEIMKEYFVNQNV
ncbi:PDDEXK family nuclease [Faecalibacter rhinopitheci]|uniref:Uncharacterized protein n=1 Tax=Faecalibacter rhinopitheci TaxID=2779678 RepID=A0A8J7K502_9FLAO|nr:hypothetical protein [Faecalibacter rhinopitheci]MBF0598324.1 hypothetical protein [Faecalibacter rhinopitheci]